LAQKRGLSNQVALDAEDIDQRANDEPGLSEDTQKTAWMSTIFVLMYLININIYDSTLCPNSYVRQE
jgi:hypothetical protein